MVMVLFLKHQGKPVTMVMAWLFLKHKGKPVTMVMALFLVAMYSDRYWHVLSLSPLVFWHMYMWCTCTFVGGAWKTSRVQVRWRSISTRQLGGVVHGRTWRKGESKVAGCKMVVSPFITESCKTSISALCVCISWQFLAGGGFTGRLPPECLQLPHCPEGWRLTPSAKLSGGCEVSSWSHDW